jgi:alcohol dehydrogenase (nicotinoprotein)
MWEANRDWDVVELELDDPRLNEVLVRFEASGMCHSDDHIRTGDYPVRFPMVGGHEGSGVVEKVGPGVRRVVEGDRVICSFIPACGTCRWCSTGHQAVCDSGLNASTGMFLDNTFRFHRGDTDLGGICALGTFSERAVISEYSCVKLAEDIPFDVAALLSCGVPTGWGSAVYAAGVRAGQSVVVYGCGGVGCNAVQGAAFAGARQLVVVDPVPFKREMAKVFGATHTFATHEEALAFVTESSWGALADHAIITVGVNSAETVSQAASIIGKLGTVTITAAGGGNESQIDMASGMLQVYLQRIQGTLAGHTNPLADLPRLMELYRTGDLKLDELITKRYSLDQVNEMYHDMLDGKNIRGVMIHPA